MNTKALSKTAQIKAERTARKQAKAAEKAKKAAILEYLLRRAQELSGRIPPEYQEWGGDENRGIPQAMRHHTKACSAQASKT